MTFCVTLHYFLSTVSFLLLIFYFFLDVYNFSGHSGTQIKFLSFLFLLFYFLLKNINCLLSRFSFLPLSAGLFRSFGGGWVSFVPIWTGVPIGGGWVSHSFPFGGGWLSFILLVGFHLFLWRFSLFLWWVSFVPLVGDISGCFFIDLGSFVALPFFLGLN
jgi:hypothetical protein